jgi:hypothetical protein
MHTYSHLEPSESLFSQLPTLETSVSSFSPLVPLRGQYANFFHLVLFYSSLVLCCILSPKKEGEKKEKKKEKKEKKERFGA